MFITVISQQLQTWLIQSDFEAKTWCDSYNGSDLDRIIQPKKKREKKLPGNSELTVHVIFFCLRVIKNIQIDKRCYGGFSKYANNKIYIKQPAESDNQYKRICFSWMTDTFSFSRNVLNVTN